MNQGKEPKGKIPVVERVAELAMKLGSGIWPSMARRPAGMISPNGS